MSTQSQKNFHIHDKALLWWKKFTTASFFWLVRAIAAIHKDSLSTRQTWNAELKNTVLWHNTNLKYQIEYICQFFVLDAVAEQRLKSTCSTPHFSSCAMPSLPNWHSFSITILYAAMSKNRQFHTEKCC